MLVYNGQFELDNIELIRRVAQQKGNRPCQQSKHTPLDMHKALGLTPPPSKTRLMFNRSCAIGLFLALNALTYFAITRLFNA